MHVILEPDLPHQIGSPAAFMGSVTPSHEWVTPSVPPMRNLLGAELAAHGRVHSCPGEGRMGGLKNVRSRYSDALSQISWDRFKHVRADYYREQGYAVHHRSSGGDPGKFDGGIDLKLRRGDEFILAKPSTPPALIGATGTRDAPVART